MAEAPAAAPRRWRRLALLGLPVLLVGWLVAGNLHVIESTKDAIVPDVASAPVREYVIVLGNKVTDRTPSRELVARLEVGRALYAAGRVRKLFVWGWSARITRSRTRWPSGCSSTAFPRRPS